MAYTCIYQYKLSVNTKTCSSEGLLVQFSIATPTLKANFLSMKLKITQKKILPRMQIYNFKVELKNT